jgi:hypothetical protein
MSTPLILLSSLGEHCPRMRAYVRFLFLASSAILFFASWKSCCHRNTSPGLTVPEEPAYGSQGSRSLVDSILGLPLQSLVLPCSPSGCGLLWRPLFAGVWFLILCFQYQRYGFCVLVPLSQIPSLPAPCFLQAFKRICISPTAMGLFSVILDHISSLMSGKWFGLNQFLVQSNLHS